MACKRFAYELVSPFMFLAGIAVAYVSPVRLQVLVAVARVFTWFFFTFAPVFIFVILAGSLSAGLGGSRLAKYVIPMFFSVCLTLSTLTSMLLSAWSPLEEAEVQVEGLPHHLLELLALNLVKPIPVSIAAGLAVSVVISPRAEVVRKAVISLHGVLMSFFKLILKVLPLVSLSFGASFYYGLGRSSLSAYVEALAMMAAFSVAYVLISLALVTVLLGVDLKAAASYTLKMFFIGLSLPSSYILLAPHLKVFSSHFDVDRSISDTVLAMGSALNRAGSAMGVVISVSVVSKYLSVPISLGEYFSLALIAAVIGFASPGIPGGTILVAMPMILNLLGAVNPEAFSLASIAVFNGITILTAPTNTVFTGYIALVVDRVIRAS